jgi:alkylation response protein AidB-like acyl-CoA dehydrogenase
VQALRSLGMTPSAENRLQAALGRIADGTYLPSGPAAWGLANDVPGRPVAVALAKAYCSQVAVHAAQECVQLHGGIGFTWEHPAHLYLKRPRRTRSRSAPRTRTAPPWRPWSTSPPP